MDRNEKAVNTDLYARVRLARMNEIEREVALNALRTADAIVDGIEWMVNGVRRLIASVTEKPAGLKHSH